MTRLVVAETDTSVFKKVSAALADLNYDVQAIGRSGDIFNTVRLSHPDLVILDVKRSGESGFEVLQKIRKHSKMLAVLVLMSERSPAIVKKLLNMGATDYLTRPFDQVELKHRILSCLHGFRSRRRASSEKGQSDSLQLPLEELHDPKTGRLHAGKIADYLGLSLSQMAHAIAVNYTTLHKTPAALSVQQPLASIKRSLVILSETIGDESSIRAWLNSPHPDLGNRPPMAVILEGRSEALCTILENALDGTPT